ncbi:MAG: PKD domain-containing protein [archaeon]|nr:PKD domain-containing protein [archaeon]
MKNARLILIFAVLLGGVFFSVLGQDVEFIDLTEFGVKIKTPSDGQEFLVNQEIKFEASAINKNDSEIKWEWDFGDGSKSDKKTITHAYSGIGEFEVKLNGIVGDETKSHKIKITIKRDAQSKGCMAIKECLSSVGKNFSFRLFD